MKLVSKKNFLIFLAAILVVALGYMAMSLSPKNNTDKSMDRFEKEIQVIETQSQSDEPDIIEKDLMDTDLTEVDTELQDIEKELNSSNY